MGEDFYRGFHSSGALRRLFYCIWKYGDKWSFVIQSDIELWVEGGDFEEFPIEILPEFWGDDGMTVFGRKD